jgi:hypothetical protein
VEQDPEAARGQLSCTTNTDPCRSRPSERKNGDARCWSAWKIGHLPKLVSRMSPERRDAPHDWPCRATTWWLLGN